jgi:hypothetical protein
MTSNRYIIDTSSLVFLNRHNPMDVFPGVWKKMDALVRSKRLYAPREVLNEIGRVDDLLLEWGKKHPGMFVGETTEQIEIVKEILSTYPNLIKADRQYAADPWVIALAIVMDRSPQRTLVEIKRIVVTEERLRGERVRIPLVCKDYSIESIDILEMFRVEGWKF